MLTGDDLDKSIKRLVNKFHPKMIILFGSQARGTADDRSDADILVVLPVEKNRRQIMVAMDRELRGLSFARDIIVITPEEFERDRYIPGTVARPAWLEGKVLYEAS